MAALLLSLSWLSCQKAPEDKGPELISVQVLESQLTLEEGGTGTLTFRVTPTDYVFSTDVAAADCPVSLVTINNVSPTHFRLASLARIGEALSEAEEALSTDTVSRARYTTPNPPPPSLRSRS